LFEALV